MPCADHTPESTPQSQPSRIGTAADELFASLSTITVSRLTAAGATGSCVTQCVNDELGGSLYASDPLARELEHLQSVLDESPANVALRTRGPVLLSDMRGEPDSAWMAFGAEALRVGICSVYTVPIQIGVIVLGVLSVYGTGPMHGERAIGEVLRLADVLALVSLGPDERERGLVNTRVQELREGHIVTHQAAGMVMVQVQGTVEDAMVLLRAAAFSSGAALRDVARQVVTRELSFSPQDIEAYPLDASSNNEGVAP